MSKGEVMKAWRLKNKERIREYEKAYRLAHKDEYAAWRKEWSSAHRDQINKLQTVRYQKFKDDINASRREKYKAGGRDTRRIEYEKNKDKYAKSHRIWSKRNRDYLREYSKIWRETEIGRLSTRLHGQRRRALLRLAPGTCSIDQLFCRFDYYGWCCYLCGTSVDSSNINIEHRIPLSRGGSNWPANLAPSCKKCNLRKHNKTEMEFRMILRKDKQLTLENA